MDAWVRRQWVCPGWNQERAKGRERTLYLNKVAVV